MTAAIEAIPYVSFVTLALWTMMISSGICEGITSSATFVMLTDLISIMSRFIF